MLITNIFVMLNLPKTGSTFAREAIKRLYSKRESKINRFLSVIGIRKPELLELLMPKIDNGKLLGFKDVHGTLRQIPVEHRNKKVISVTRNPFSRYVSSFYYRSWEKFPPTDIQTIRTYYPNYPNLSFAEFYEMMHIFGRENFLRGIVPKIELGISTIQFIQFFFNDPESVLKKIDDDYIDSREFEKDMGNIHFIHQENLREELIEFLAHIGIPRDELDFITSLKKVNVTLKKTNTSHHSEIITPMIEQKILEREKLIFTIFPMYKS